MRTVPARAPRPVRRTVVGLLLALFIAGGSPVGAQVGAASAEGPSLPVARVVLYTNGVAYFVHEGTVRGDQTLTLPVPVARMDDLLQSLVLEDLDGGSIEPVRYGARDPLGRVLGSYSLDLSGNPTLAQLLAQARGEAVRIEATQTLSATIVNVERIDHPEHGPRTFLTVLADGALRRFPLDEVRTLRFERPELQAELEAALAAIARHRGDEQAGVTLAFAGAGERRVRVAYLREMPVWKTTYRLLLNGDGSADLQGWAILDNPTELDLVDVQVSFVAGSPVSFVPRLFEPVYVRRPSVDAATTPGLAPRPPLAEAPAPAPAAARSAVAEMAMETDAVAPQLADAGVRAMASVEGGDTAFAYVVGTPVTVGRFESALVPVLLTTVSAPRVSFYDPTELEGRAFHAVRLVNDGGAHLAAGPVAVFDASGFVGSALLTETGPDDARLLTFAIDRELELVREAGGASERVVAVRIRGGVIESEVRQRVVTRYRVLPRPGAERLLLIDHRARAGYELVSPTPAPSRTAVGYRFGVRVGGAADGDDPVPVQLTCAGDAACLLEVVEERVEERRLQVVNVPTDLLVTYLENVALDDEVRALLEDLVDVQRRLVEVERSLQVERSRIDAIAHDQSRIRQNMGALDRTSALYARYLADLEAQEDELVAIRDRIDLLERAREELRRQLDEIVARTG